MDADRIAPFGRAVALALLAGCVLALQAPALPSPAIAFALCAAGVLAWRRPGITRLAGAACAGLGWCLVHAHAASALRIDPRLEDRPLHLSGTVSGLPERGVERQRFGFRVDAAVLDGRPVPLRGEVRLSHWRDPASIVAGERLALVAVLRRPRALLNPGGFDFERLALERRIAATGHVRRILDRAPAPDGIDVRRARLAARIAAEVEDAEAAALLRALAVGDQAAIGDPLWEAFRATGTTHLVAISGFHIGLVGAFAALLGGLVHRAIPGAGWRVPRRTLAACCALAGAGAYSLLASFSLPVQRTLAMLAAVLLAVALRRRLSIGGALGLAVIVVLLFDPLAVLNAGFWLSFGGVFWLLFALDGRSRTAWWRGYARAQWVAFIALLPLGVAWFQQASLVGPLVNLFAIPWVSFLLVPMLLAGLALGDLGGPLLHLAGLAARAYLDALGFAAATPLAWIDLPAPGTAAFALAVAGAGLWLLPRAVPGRALAILLFLPLVLPRIERPPPGAADVVVLDVGQGMAIVVRTANHALLFDAGPARGEGHDAGEAVVLPALRALGVRQLDRVVVSHGDNDHAGGVAAVLRAFPNARVASGPGVGFGTACRAGTRWRWDHVAFEFLHPPEHFPPLRNEASCVLRVVAGDRAALLPGDIGAIIEARLVADGAGLAADLLLLAHHGSRGSNSDALLDAVRPRIAVASAGHRNRFGHPAPDVAARLAARGIPLHATASGGALRYRIAPGALVVRGAERRAARRPWREP
jgi:competence protein ComEC